MVTLEQMAEAHLLNVQREIASLNERKTQIDGEIKRLTDYLNEGISVLKNKEVPQPDSSLK